jgi:hypothetical protein
MVVYVKATFDIRDMIMRRLEREAGRRGCTRSALAEAALQSMLSEEPSIDNLPRLPVFSGGGARADVTNCRALYAVMKD